MALNRGPHGAGAMGWRSSPATPLPPPGSSRHAGPCQTPPPDAPSVPPLPHRSLRQNRTNRVLQKPDISSVTHTSRRRS
jgi:hypothetical protein